MDRKPRTKENWYDVHDLGEGVWGIAEWGHQEEVLSFLLLGDSEGLLIDTGLGFFSMRAVVEALTDKPVTVINTHSHFDHIGSNAEFDRVWMPEHPKNRKRAAEGLSADFVAEFVTPEMCWGEVPAGLPDPYTIKPFPHARFFNNGAIFECHPFRLEAIHTPGHCEDHMIFVDRAKGLLFAGDNLYDGPIFVQADGGLAKFRSSVNRMVGLDGVRQIFPSHNGFEIERGKLLQLQNVLQEIETDDLEGTVEIDGPLRIMPVPYAA